MADFGTSKLLGTLCNVDCESAVMQVCEMSRELTKGVGTLLWCAPEVLRGDGYGLPADVYRCVLSELITPYSTFF